MQKTPINAIIEDPNDEPCYCDHGCLDVGDCCPDFKDYCGGKSTLYDLFASFSLAFVWNSCGTVDSAPEDPGSNPSISIIYLEFKYCLSILKRRTIGPEWPIFKKSDFCSDTLAVQFR